MRKAIERAEKMRRESVVKYQERQSQLNDKHEPLAQFIHACG